MSQSQTTDDESSTEMDSKCTEILCQSLQNIADSLKYYQTANISSNSKDISLYFEKYKYLVSDYHHILANHINRDKQTQQENDKSFQSIYEFVTSHVQCDFNVDKCAIYLRNNRCRETNNMLTNDEPLLFYIDMMDTIHCHFLHSYDCGYRATPDKKLMNNNKMDPSLFCIDSQMIKLKKRLKNSRYHLKNIRGDIRFYNHKFVTNVAIKNTNNCDNDEYEPYFFSSRESVDEITDDDTDSDSFEDGSIPKKTPIQNDFDTFGYRYYYWAYYKHNWSHTDYAKWYVEKKYKNLKLEIINNKLYRLELSAYNYIYYKACKILRESQEIRAIKSDYTEIALRYGIADGLALNVSNLMAIILYSDYDILSYNLSKTFQKLIYFPETDSQIKKRNAEYWNWCKILRETVECYGNFVSDSTVETYYHCTNHVIFDKFKARFCAPTSTTTTINVITSLVYENGIILELQPYQQLTSSLRSFNCSFLSCFANESERLLFGGYDTVKFTAIRIVKSNENYKYFINAMQLLDQVLNAETDSNDIKYDKEYNIAKLLMSQNEKNELSEYIRCIFEQYCNRKKTIEIDLVSFNNEYKKFKKIFVDKRTNNLILIDFICNIFKNCEKIIIDNNARHLSSRYLSILLAMIKNINKDKNIKLKLIKVERIQFDKKEINKFIRLYGDNNWNLKIKESKTVQFGRWINIANLSVSKVCQRHSFICTPTSETYEISNDENRDNNIQHVQEKECNKQVMIQSVTALCYC